jgi:hypothetical protein
MEEAGLRSQNGEGGFEDQSHTLKEKEDRRP